MSNSSPLRGARRLAGDRRGAAIVEFAIVAPTFFLFVFAIFGVGLGAFYQQALDDAVRDAARQVQMGDQASSSASGFTAAVCAEFGILAASCQLNISYAVQAGSASGGFASLSPATLNAAGQFSNTFFGGNAFGPSVPVLVQVAYPMPFKLPYIGNLITGTGTGSIVATAAVYAEPYQ